MKIIKGLLYVLIVLLLFACASSNKQVKYYSLTLNNEYPSLATIHQANTANTKQPRVVVGPIHLARFLRQDGLVIQIGEHEIVTANYHRWAEPLEEAIAKLLVQELNSKSDYYQFARMAGQWDQNATLHLRLEFDKFHATDNAKIVASGRYWLHEQNKALRMGQTFNVSNHLTRDGYLHAVEKLEQAIGKLSDQIIASLNHVEKH
jgi:uncharacterized protein